MHILLLCLLISLNLTLVKSKSHLKSEEFDKATSFFDKWLNPSNCSYQHYAIVEMGNHISFFISILITFNFIFRWRRWICVSISNGIS